MKKGVLACVTAFIISGDPLSFHWQYYSQQTTITGKITPSEAADVALLIREKDTLKAPVVWGNFSMPVKPGTYKLLVSAKAPYKNVSLGNLEVKQNHALNVGELILQK